MPTKVTLLHRVDTRTVWAANSGSLLYSKAKDALLRDDGMALANQSTCAVMPPIPRMLSRQNAKSGDSKRRVNELTATDKVLRYNFT